MEHFATRTFYEGTINDVIGNTFVIFSAVEHDRTDVVTILIKIDANSLNARDTGGSTPLMRAVKKKIVKVL